MGNSSPRAKPKPWQLNLFSFLVIDKIRVFLYMIKLSKINNNKNVVFAIKLFLVLFATSLATIVFGLFAPIP